MPDVQFWKYESVSAKRRREQAAFIANAEQKRQEYLSPTPPPPPAPAPSHGGSLLGRAAHALKVGVETATSGERFINAITPGDQGTNIRHALEEVPVAGKALGIGFDIAAAPATLVTAGYGGVAAGALTRAAAVGGARGILARAAANVVAPVVEGGVVSRLAGETALGTGASIASQKATELLPEDTNPLIKTGVGLAAGLGGGVAGVGLLRKGLPQYFEITKRMGDAGIVPLGGTLKDVSGERLDSIPLTSIDTRPDLFQARNVPEGQSFRQGRVEDIKKAASATGWDIEKGRIDVVPNPDKPGRYIVVQGHHRLEAARQLGKEDISVVVRPLDISNPEHLKIAETVADLGNYLSAPNTLGDDIGAFTRARSRGLDVPQIATEFQRKASEVQSVLDTSLLGPNVIDRLEQVKALQPVASEVGRGMRVYGIPQEEAVAMFDRVAKTDVKGKVVSATAMRDTIDKFGRLFSETASQPTMAGFQGLEGMGKGRFLDLIDQHAQAVTEAERGKAEIKSLTNRLKKVQGRPDATPGEVANATGLLETESARLAKAQDDIERLNKDFETMYRRLAGGEPVSLRPSEAPAPLAREGIAGVQKDIFGNETPVYQPNNEAQGAMAIGQGERPVSTAGPMFEGTGAVPPAAETGGVARPPAAPPGSPPPPPRGPLASLPAPGPPEPAVPGAMDLQPPPRKGELLNAPTAPVNTVKEALAVGRDLERTASSQANRLKGIIDLNVPALGKITKGADGNIYLADIKPAPADLARGQTQPLFQRVLEFKSEYDLTPEQIAAIDNIAEVPASATREVGLFGVERRQVPVEEGNNFVPRLPRQIKGKTVNEGSGTGGRRLGGAKDRGRYYADPGEAVAKGVVYADPREAVDAFLGRSLKLASDQHVADLLVPFKETPSVRVPEGLRNQMEGLQQKVSGLVATAERLDTREHATINYYLGSQLDGLKAFSAANEPNLDALRTALDKISVGLKATGQEGPNFGKGKAEILAELRATKKEIAALQPEWQDALEYSRKVPPGRAMVSEQYAPALRGSDFTVEDAKRIEDYYARGHVPPNQIGKAVHTINAANAALIPVRAIGDASATLNQLGVLLSSNPVQFAKSFVKSLGYMVDDASWAARLQGEDAALAAQHGVVIMGRAGERQELQLSNWMMRVPGLRESAKHFERFTTDMRITVFNDMVDAAEKAGKTMSEVEMDQAGRALNRLTGISIGKAGDVEQLMEFAPNFLRAHVENIVHAVSDGSLEGDIARKYLRNYAAMGTLMVAAAAVSQGRDLSEVLNPFRTDALKKGELKMNSNFATIRFLGQDMHIFGAYDSIARLLVVNADAVRGAITEREAMQLFDGIGYTTGSKGGPVAQFASDLIKGSTFSGEDPLSLSANVKRVLPFTATTAIQDIQGGAPPGAVAASAAIGFLGGKSNPLSATERLDEQAQRRYGENFYDLPSSQRLNVQRDNPELWKNAVSQQNQKLQRNDQLKGEITDKQKIDDAALLSGQLDRGAWLKNYGDRRKELIDRRKEIFLGSGGGGDQRLKPYFDVIDKATLPNGTVDWDQVDSWKAGQRPETMKYIDDNVGLGGTAVGQVYRALQAVRTQYFQISPYKGYTADQARSIDSLYADVRDRAGSNDDARLLRAMRAVVTENGITDAATVRGVRRLILGQVEDTKGRERFKDVHPELSLFDSYSRAKLTPAERAYLQRYAAKPEIVARAG